MLEASRALRRAATVWLLLEQRMGFVAEECPVSSRFWLVKATGERVPPFSLPWEINLRATIIDVEGRTADAVGLRLARELRMDGKKRTKRIDAETSIVEVKVSRADFLAGIRKGQIGTGAGSLGEVADRCTLFTTPGVARPEEVPLGWALFEFGDDDVQRAARTWRPSVWAKRVVRGRRLRPPQPLTVDLALVAATFSRSALHRLYRPGALETEGAA